LEEAVSRHRTSGDRHGEAEALMNLGTAQADTGSTAAARASLTEALRIAEQTGNQEQASKAIALITSLTGGRG
jgi:Tfp pilus assembly protein PilF